MMMQNLSALNLVILASFVSATSDHYMQNAERLLICLKFLEESKLKMLVAAHSSYDPNKTVIQIDPSDVEEMGFQDENNDKIAVKAKNNLCLIKLWLWHAKIFTCSPPVQDPKSLESLLVKQRVG